MISLTDHVLLLAVVTFLCLIPKPSGYRARTWLLVSEFAAFSGLYVVMVGYDPLWFYMFSAMLSFLYMMGFILLRSPWLSALSGAISLFNLSIAFAYYHEFDLFINATYYPVMLVICLLQLLCIMPGVLYGIRRVLYGRFLADRRDRNSHDFAN